MRDGKTTIVPIDSDFTPIYHSEPYGRLFIDHILDGVYPRYDITMKIDEDRIKISRTNADATKIEYFERVKDGTYSLILYTKNEQSYRIDIESMFIRYDFILF